MVIVFISGTTVKREEFISYFKLEKNALTSKLVRIVPTEEPERLNFCEMVGILWDFLSRDPHGLGSFAFYLFDKNRDGLLNRKETVDLLECLHHTSASKYRGIDKIVSVLFGLDKDFITIIAFHNFCHEHDEVCMILLGLQNTLRERILGKSFWEAIMRKRSSCPEQLEANYTRLLFEQKIALNEERIEAERVAKLVAKKDARLAELSSRDGDHRERKRTNFLFNKLFVSHDGGCSLTDSLTD